MNIDILVGFLECVDKSSVLSLDKLKDKYSNEELESIIKRLEILEFVTIVKSKEGESFVKITDKGRKFLEIFKPPSFWERLFDFFLFNKLFFKFFWKF